MSLRIEARPQISRQVLYLTPLLAVALTVIAGFFIFLLLGHNPVAALYHFFVSPLTSLYGLSELGVKAAPLIMIGALTYVAFVPEGPMDAFTVLPIQIFNWTSRPQKDFQNVAAAGIIVLLAALLAMNAVAVFLRHRFEKRKLW